MSTERRRSLMEKGVKLFPIGGRIFYDNGQLLSSYTTPTYRFYNANKVEISYSGVGSSVVATLNNAGVAYYSVEGSRPTYTQSGVTRELDRFFVWDTHMDFSNVNNQGTFQTSAVAISSVFIGNSNYLQGGKQNTSIMLSQSSKGTIWTKLNTVNSNKDGGCDDWYIPSQYEFKNLVQGTQDSANASFYIQNVYSKPSNNYWGSWLVSTGRAVVYISNANIFTEATVSSVCYFCPIRSF